MCKVKFQESRIQYGRIWDMVGSLHLTILIPCVQSVKFVNVTSFSFIWHAKEGRKDRKRGKSYENI